MSTRNYAVYKSVKEHYPISKEHHGAREHQVDNSCSSAKRTARLYRMPMIRMHEGFRPFSLHGLSRVIRDSRSLNWLTTGTTTGVGFSADADIILLATTFRCALKSIHPPTRRTKRSELKLINHLHRVPKKNL
jgi:hypothetical protein